jgi:lysophospholipase L1-like esterase
MLDTQEKLEGPARLLHVTEQSSWVRFLFLIFALLAIVLNRLYIPNIHYDWLNIIPLLAALYVGYALVAFKQTCGHFEYVARCMSQAPDTNKPIGRFLLSPWVRSMLLLPVLLLASEFGLRCVSYHRALLYQRQGDLLYAPIPNQEYVEKISLSHSRVNEYGLRGGPVQSKGRHIVLCLGDSVTYGYGVDDQHTYPEELQKALDRKYPGRFLVLNGGVDGYPVAFMRMRFRDLWDRGIHPDVVVVGYSFNEGGALPQYLAGDEQTKERFAARVQMKNRVRTIALYNLIVENWARASYNRMKKYMVPGTNNRTLSPEEVQTRYRKSLQESYDDFRSRHVRPVFALFAGYDGRTGQYDTLGPFQVKFREFAESHAIPLLPSKQVLMSGESETTVRKYFQDQCHMKEIGTQKFSQGLADLLSTLLPEHPSPAKTFSGILGR